MSSDPRKFLDVQLKFMQAIGMWPIHFTGSLPTKSKFWKKFSYWFQTAILFISSHITILHTRTTFEALDSKLEDLSDFLTSTIIYAFTFFIVLYFIARRKILVKMIRLAEAAIRIRSAPGLTYITADTGFKRTRLCFLCWITLCISGAVLWAAFPLLTLTRVLPLRCEYPFDVMKPVVYELTYLTQLLGQIEVGLSFGMVSGLYMSLVMLICCQFDILFCSLKNVYHSALLRSARFHKQLKLEQLRIEFDNEECGQYYFNVSEQLEDINQVKADESIPLSLGLCLQSTIKDCVDHHEDILALCALMEDFYNPFCLVKSLQVTFQFCFLAFVFVNTTTSSPIRFVNLLQYLFLTLAEFLMFTYFADMLSQQSVRVSDAILRSPWHLLGRELRGDLLILMSNTRRPVRLTGGKFFIMNIDRFQLVLGTGFSYFTLLQALES